MGYSNTATQKQTVEKGDSFSGTNAQRKMGAVPVLQKAVDEEELPVQGVLLKSPESKNVAQLQYDLLSNTWQGKPPSPKTGPIKVARDQAKTTLPLNPGQQGHTANHKYGSASIIADIMSGLDPSKDNATQLRTLQNCASFRGIPLPAAITNELQLPLAQRTVAFKVAVETFVNQVVWTPFNIFFSEDCTKRDDDLHDGSALDQHFTASGAATPRSSVSREIKLNQGLSHIDPQLLASRLLELQQNNQTNPSALTPADWTPNTARTNGHFKQLGDPVNWTTPFSEIIYPKNGERIQSDSYTLRINTNQNTQRVFVKIQFIGTDGNWLPARVGDPGVWWFDWHNIPQGSFELMAKSVDNLNNEFVSHHVRVTR